MLHSQLYYEESANIVEHGTSETAQLDIDKVLANDPKCWIQIEQSTEKKCKTLILSHWWMEHLESTQLHKACDFLLELLHKKFPIKIVAQKTSLVYFYEERVFKQLEENPTPKTLSLYKSSVSQKEFSLIDLSETLLNKFRSREIATRTQLLSDREIEDLLRKKKLNKLKTFIIDDVSLNTLLNERYNEDNQPVVSLVALLAANFSDNELNTALIKYKKIIVDVISRQSLDFSKKIHKLNSAIIVNSNFSKFDRSLVRNVLVDSSWSMFLNYDLRDIVVVCFDRVDLSLEATVSILEKNKTIKMAKIIRCTNFKSIIHDIVQKYNFTLITAAFEHSDISIEGLNFFLKGFKILKKAVFMRCENLQGEIERLPEGSLLDLECLTFQLSNVSLHTLEEILISKHKLKTIHLIFCRNIGGDIKTLPSESISELEEVDFYSSTVSNATLEYFIRFARKLKRLNIGYCSVSVNMEELPVPLPEGILSELEELYASNSRIHLFTLRLVLRRAHKLRRLILREANNIGGNIGDLTGIELLELEEIDFSCSPVSIVTIRSIITCCSDKLKKIYVFRCSSLSDDDVQSLIRDNEKIEIIYKVLKSPDLVDKNTLLLKSQNMIMRKLKFYLETYGNAFDKANISRMEMGICFGLSVFFTQSPDDCEDFINKMQSWDIEKSTEANNVPGGLQEFYRKYVVGFQFKPPENDLVYIGDYLHKFLSKVKVGERFIFYNYNHALAVYKEDSAFWRFYDSNNADGVLSGRDLQMVFQDILGGLGSVISLKLDKKNTRQIPATESLKNPEVFISEGGLILLSQEVNPSRLLRILSSHHYTDDSIEKGLFVKTDDKMPAWFHGVSSKNKDVSKFTQKLIDIFKRHDPENATKRLEKSFSEIEKFSGNEDSGPAIQLSKEMEKIINNANGLKLEEEACRALKDQYLNLFNTWNVPVSSNDLGKCLDEWTNGKTLRRLIEVNSKSDVEALWSQLVKYCQETGRPVFYANSAKDLICAADFVSIDDHNKATLTKGPGGPRYNFLRKNKGNRPVFIVRYSNFKDEDFVKYNTFLEDNNADFQIIGLRDMEPGFYEGTDFPPRFNERVQINDSIPFVDKLSVEARHDSSEEALKINLFHSVFWENLLVGGLELTTDGSLLFKPGALNDIPPTIQKIEIINGPWENPEFVHFLERLRRGFVFIGDKQVTINRELQFVKSEGYDWHDVSQWIQVIEGPSAGRELLNPSRFSHFFGGYECDIQEQLIKKEGFLKNFSGSVLKIYVTRELSVDHWAMLLESCKKLKVKLEVCCAPWVKLPSELGQQPQVFFEPIDNFDRLSIIESSDKQGMIKQIQTYEPGDWIVIDISDVEVGDLVDSIGGGLDAGEEGQPSRFRFYPKKGALLPLLAAGKDVILTGALKPEMIDCLRGILEKRATFAGKFRLVCDLGVAAAFSDIVNIVRHIMNDEAFFWNREEWIRVSKARWLSQDICLEGGEEAYRVLTEHRLTLVKEVLAESPYVQIIGPSESGKTLFIEQECTVKNGMILYRGELLRWLEDTVDDGFQKVLFMEDKPTKFTQFGGLFSKNPTILVGNKLHYLTNRHKVIFVDDLEEDCNVSQGRTIFFEMPPPVVIYEKMLKPILESSCLSESEQREASLSILGCYKSPREAQLMALLIAEQGLSFEEQPFKTAVISTKFVITPSRQKLMTDLDDLLMLRATKGQGGVRGIIIEGNPGIGKSEMVLLALKQRKLEANKHFYPIAASMPLKEKQELLLKAWNEGAVVVMDELNAGSMPVDLLKKLLKGRYQGRPPQHSGFLLFATQNPEHIASGRQKIPDVLKKLCMNIELSEYLQEECQHILKIRCPEKSDLEQRAISEAYVQQRTYAQKNHLIGVPTFRDFINIVEKHRILMPVPPLLLLGPNRRHRAAVRVEAGEEEADDFKAKRGRRTLKKAI